MSVGFREHEGWEKRNRQIARDAMVGRAYFSNGGLGVVVKIAGMPIVLRRDEALNLCNRIADEIPGCTE
ncbi:hypothetical protein [Brevibacterium zhoupengii]|uniref:hypothetical protein n=1 Tax=Brevibacterium zhoupengii TaxID=2898795 RepID=UPI001E4FA7A7|nr:hypothetical protein [Brevibacterium zhoupengii]